MPTLPKRLLNAALLAILAVALFWPGSTSAQPPLQRGLETPEIAEPECSFYLDRDGDGEGNERFDAEPEEYVPQETPIVGGCTFKLNTPAEATMVVESELKDWNGDFKLKKEPGIPTEHKVYPGDKEIPNVQGSMVVTLNFRGNTPRSIRSRTLPDGYWHEVQIPEEFQLLEVTVVTADGRRDRLEKSVKTASVAHIQAYRQLSEQETELPNWAVALAQERLAEGYPQFADHVITMAMNSGNAGSGGINRWMWSAIITWAVIFILGAVGGLLYIKNH